MASRPSKPTTKTTKQPEDPDWFIRRAAIFVVLMAVKQLAGPLFRQLHAYFSHIEEVDYGEWGYYGDLEEYESGQMTAGELVRFQDRASQLSIAQARRVISGGLLIEGCPADDIDPTAALYCGVYHPLAADDTTAPAAVAASSDTIEIVDETEVDASRYAIFTYKGFPVWRNQHAHLLFHSARMDPAVWYLSTIFAPEDQLSKAHTAMAPVYAVPTSPVEDHSRNLWSWAMLVEIDGKETLMRRELKLRVTELKGKDMLNNYIEDHAEDKAYEEAFAQEAGL